MQTDDSIWLSLPYSELGYRYKNNILIACKSLGLSVTDIESTRVLHIEAANAMQIFSLGQLVALSNP